MTTPPPYYGPPGGEPGGVPAAPENTQGLVGMILGIVSIPLACCFYLGIPVGIAGAIVSYLGLQKANTGRATNRSQAMAGLITGAIGAVVGIGLLIWAIVYGSSINWEDFSSTN
ncbi:hypothetical protein KOI35_35120 [Actinoplanes bogorensis]|uniref:DUF4190 domain-containing protein n=1 Tax=Paractinoplanes bogorensis TaxID=1610840 RepID=A0ABS5YZ82_9ACTN|nr:hypothetical protein [Actinoplanes bogorensis]MBU2668755.1 hypothetical protein [Actinoplanes bogorensis]